VIDCHSISITRPIIHFKFPLVASNVHFARR
jgi:hypothetical protein